MKIEDIFKESLIGKVFEYRGHLCKIEKVKSISPYIDHDEWNTEEGVYVSVIASYFTQNGKKKTVRPNLYLCDELG